MKDFISKFRKNIGCLLILILFCLLYPVDSYSQGTTFTDSLFSTSLNKYVKCNIYLPQGYNPNGTTYYRVVYFLHGVNTNHNSYSFVSNILDSLISNNLMQPVICVKPNGSCAPYLGSFYTNSALYGQYENFIYNDLVQYIDSHYKTKTDRNSRCIMGHSMGGYGSMKIAMKHSGIYRAVASHSGPLDFTQIPLLVPIILPECGGGPPYSYLPTNGAFSAMAFTMAGAFTPNLSNPPFYVDFPLSPAGTIIDSLFTKFKVHGGARLSMNINSGSNLALYFDCGIQDELGMLLFNISFKDTLVLRNIPYRYSTYTGTHSNKLPERFAISLKYLDSVMTNSVGINPVGTEIPGKFKLYHNYPNPFNPVTNIKFDIPKSQNVKLIVFDMLGREVRTLVNEHLNAGVYETQFDASGISSGTYFYKLEAGKFRDIKKLVLIK